MLDFFEQQQRARRRTAVLVGVYVAGLVVFVAVVAPVLMCFASIVATAVTDKESRRSRGSSLEGWHRLGETMLTSPTQTFGMPEGQILWLGTSGFTVALVLGASAWKAAMLRAGGGKVVAESLGARRVVNGASDFYDQRLLNVVEEMAIASSVPVPPVYVLDDERAINAFAAGFTSSDAVVAVTRGAMRGLTREQLQGVIGHEFSHILNGDMRLNIRLVGMLYGVLAVQLLARVFFSIGRGALRDGDRGSIPIALLFFVFGLILLLLGLAGALVARIVKAAIGREREYLADASSAQFTRNPGALAGALRVVGGSSAGGTLDAGGAEEFSHLYFVGGVSGWLESLTETHPPLDRRIVRLDPSWDGTWLEASGETIEGEEAVRAGSKLTREELAGAFLLPPLPVEGSRTKNPPRSVGVPKAEGPARSVGVPSGGSAGSVSVVEATTHVGGLTPEEVFARVESARGVLERIPPKMLAAARDGHDARSLVLGMILDGREGGARQEQMGVIAAMLDTEAAEASGNWDDALRGLGPAGVRMPLLEVAISAMATLSPQQYQQFRRTVQGVVGAKRTTNLFTASVERMLMVHLDRRFGMARPRAVQYYALTRLGEECSLVLSAATMTAGLERDRAASEMSEAGARLGFSPARLLERSEITPVRLQGALETLGTASPKLRVMVVRAMAEIIGEDGRVTAQEAELLRVVADSLDVPIALRTRGA